jgi:hypothetical protein
LKRRLSMSRQAYFQSAQRTVLKAIGCAGGGM